MSMPIDRFVVALAAGATAILLNSCALTVADLIPLETAHGGLLKLLLKISAGTIRPPLGDVFPFEFHVVVGLLVALFYAYVLEPRLPGPSWVRGLIYAAIAWLMYAVVVLPALGEGLAGYQHLTLAGMLWFAAAHTLFFVLTAVLYEHLLRWSDFVNLRAQPHS